MQSIWVNKKIDANPKSIQQIEFVGELKNTDGVNADDTQSIFVLTISGKIKETKSKFSHWSVTVLWKTASYEEARVKLTNTQPKKIKSAAKRLEQH